MQSGNGMNATHSATLTLSDAPGVAKTTGDSFVGPSWSWGLIQGRTWRPQTTRMYPGPKLSVYTSGLGWCQTQEATSK